MRYRQTVITPITHRLRVATEPERCMGAWTSSGGEIVTTLDRPLSDDAELAAAHPGTGIGC